MSDLNWQSRCVLIQMLPSEGFDWPLIVAGISDPAVSQNLEHAYSQVVGEHEKLFADEQARFAKLGKRKLLSFGIAIAAVNAVATKPDHIPLAQRIHEEISRVSGASRTILNRDPLVGCIIGWTKDFKSSYYFSSVGDIKSDRRQSVVLPKGAQAEDLRRIRFGKRSDNLLREIDDLPEGAFGDFADKLIAKLSTEQLRELRCRIGEQAGVVTDAGVESFSDERVGSRAMGVLQQTMTRNDSLRVYCELLRKLTGNDLVSEREAADLLAISRGSVQHAVSTGKIRAIEVGTSRSKVHLSECLTAFPAGRQPSGRPPKSL